MRHSGCERKRWGKRVAVEQDAGRSRQRGIPPRYEDVIAAGIEPPARLEDHDGAIQARGELFEVVHVGVIHQGPGARQAQVGHERVACLD